jgi:hypothetical protein
VHTWLASFDLVQHVTGPTLEKGHTLDICVTQRTTGVDVSVDLPCVNTDHSLIIVTLPFDHTITQVRPATVRRQWAKFDIGAFRVDLAVSDFITQPCGENCSKSFSRYDATMKSLIDKHAPLKTVRNRAFARSRWYTEECRLIKIKTRRLERVYRTTHDTIDRARWKTRTVRVSTSYLPAALRCLLDCGDTGQSRFQNTVA